MWRRWKVWLTRASWLVLAGVAIANAGCLLAAAGAAAGGVAAYYYFTAPVERTFPADYADVRNAAVAALQDLNMPVVNEDHRAEVKGTISSRASDAESVEIKLTSVPSLAPGEKTVTRVSVRVTWKGDTDFSNRLLDQMAAHLAYAVPGATVAPSPTSGPLVPAGWHSPGSNGPKSTVAPPAPPPLQTEEPPKAN